MRPGAQLSDSMSWDTSVYDKIFWEDVWHVCAIISRALEGGKLYPDPRVTRAQETGYPELVLVQNLRLTRGLPCSVCAITETGGEVTLDDLNDISTSRPDTGLPISYYDGGNQPLYVPGE